MELSTRTVGRLVSGLEGTNSVARLSGDQYQDQKEGIRYQDCPEISIRIRRNELSSKTVRGSVSGSEGRNSVPRQSGDQYQD
jgi:hypothetical protein